MRQYKVTIESVEKVQETKQQWSKLHDKKDFDAKLEPQYGYVEATTVSTKEEVVYTQVVDDLDMKQVIDAVNAKTKQV